MANQNSANQDYQNNADGAQLGGGVIKRILKWLGADITITGSGTANITLPSQDDTLVGRASTDTITGDKTFTGNVVLPNNSVKSSNVDFATILYSSTEQRIGTWIDGRPLYRKVLNAGSLPSNSTSDTAYNITNLGQFTHIYGAAVVTGASAEVRPIPHYNPSSTAGSIGVSAIVSAGVIRLYTVANLSSFTGYLIIEYTKTS